MRRLVTCALGLALVASLGCSSETFRGHAFLPGPRHYRVRYLHDRDREVLPEGWSIVNYRTDSSHRPTDPFRGREDEVRVAIDVDGDRDVDVRGLAPRYDLLYQHDEDGAEIALMTIPIDGRLAHRSLELLAHALVDGAFGQGFVEWDGDRARSYQTRIVEEQQAVVGGADAHLLTFEIAQVVPGAGPAFGRGVTVTIVVVRPGELRWRGSGRAEPGSGAPMLVLAMLEARSPRYELHRPAFESLLDRIDVRPDGLPQADARSDEDDAPRDRPRRRRRAR